MTKPKYKNYRQRALALGYRSGIEIQMSVWCNMHGIHGEFEAEKIPYTVPASDHTYTPDFVLKKKDGSNMYIETKGRWSSEDREKIYLVKEQHPDMDLRIAFSSDPHKSFIGKKGGTSYADVCTQGKGRNRAPFRWVDFNIPFCWADVGTKTKRHSLMLPQEWMDELEGFDGTIIELRPEDLVIDF